MKIKREVICSILIVLFHTVGLIGLLSASFTALFLKLVPFHLLLMQVLLIISHNKMNKKFVLFLTITYTAGYLIEFLGVKTGIIFGEYFYEETLGLKLFQIPLIIGCNWIIIIYSVGTSLNKLTANTYIKCITGATLLVLLDVLIEPVAIRYNYWEWTKQEIPLQNYLAWFVFSIGMLWIFFKLLPVEKNSTGLVMISTQVLFFAALNLWAL